MLCTACGASLDDVARFCSACGTAVHRDAEAPADPLRDALQKTLPSNMRIVRPLGRGGMGAVYLARDEFLDREVAVKVLTSQYGDDGGLRERFRREARIAAKLHHPHIVPLHTFGEADHILYYVMGFVRGETLADRLHRDGTLEQEEARRILAEIADALSYAHAQSVIHRDLKPENILLDDATGSAVLADFGIARLAAADSLTQAGAVIGTPLYMSPEQAVGKTVDHRSDLYSLGVVGYRMLTGRLPVAGETISELIAQHAGKQPDAVTAIDPAIAGDLNEAIMRCLAKEPRERYATAAELRDALRGTAGQAVETEDMQSVGFYGAIFLWIAAVLGVLEALAWQDLDPGWRLLIELVQFIPFMYAMLFALRVIEGRRRGMAWRAIMRTLFLPPRWYMGWMPAMLRPIGDPWQRLPRSVRAYRTGFTLMVLFATAMALFVPLTVMSLDAHKGLAMVVIAMWNISVIALVTLFVVANRSLRESGLTRAERSIVMHNASWTLGKLQSTNIAKLLSTPVPPSAKPASTDATTKVTTAVIAR